MEDNISGLMRIIITVTATNEGSDEPFARASGTFHFLFESSEPAEPATINAALRSSGIEIALSVIRGLIGGATTLLSLPPVYTIPYVDPTVIEWEDEAENE